MIIGGLQLLSLCDYPGRPTTVIFTQGCNFRCPFCHNSGLLPMTPVTPVIAESAALKLLHGRRPFVDAVVVSGGEPTLHDDLPELLGSLRRLNLAIKLDTNGSRPEMIARLIRCNLVDFIAMDVKASPEKYDLLAGVSVSWEVIRSSIQTIAGSGIRHSFRTTVDASRLTPEDLQTIREELPPTSTYRLQVMKQPAIPSTDVHSVQQQEGISRISGTPPGRPGHDKKPMYIRLAGRNGKRSELLPS
jgi:pyruvate formate lyase activating enzyme